MIIADRRDYEAVAGLVGPIFGALAAEGVTPAIRATVEAVADMTRQTSAPATLAAVAAKLGIDKAAASRRVRAAARRGWLINDEKRAGYPAQLRTGDPLPVDRPALPEIDALFPSETLSTGQRSDNSPHPDKEKTVDATVDATVDGSTPPSTVGAVDAEPLTASTDSQRFDQRPVPNADATNEGTVDPLTASLRGIEASPDDEEEVF